MRYTTQSLIRAVVRDLVNDARTAETRDKDRPGMLRYAAECRARVATIYRQRHGLRVDRYGMPAVRQP